MIGIYTNLDRDCILLYTTKLIRSLEIEGIDFACYYNLKGKVSCDKLFDANDLSGVELIISLGGDGTILSAASLFSSHSVPVCGINLGKVGFLADVEIDAIPDCVRAIKNKKYKIIERSMLYFSFAGGCGDALNELTISRNRAEKSLNFNVTVRGETVSSFFGDGFLVSTPTGSTAYSLSAGGPIVAADVNCFILTPLNAHSMFARSIIVSDIEEIVVTVDNPASVIADGRLVGVTDEVITIRKSERAAKFVVFSGKNFYSKLRKKLSSISILPEEC